MSADKVLKAGGLSTKGASKSGKVKSFFMGVFDAIAAIIVLALAVMGAQQILQANLDYRVKLGVAVFIVVFLAGRLVERAFSVER